MSFNDQEIRRFLLDYAHGYERSSWGAIDPDGNPYKFRPDRLPGSMHGSSGVSYHYDECAKSREAEKRHVEDGSGYWQRLGGEIKVGDGSNVMYKQRFKFIPRGNGPRTSVMTEYTLYSQKSGKNKKAICAIQEEGS